jgi:hypothetical protein
MTMNTPNDDKPEQSSGGADRRDFLNAKSLLRLTQRFPPKYEQIMVLSFTMTIDQPADLLRKAGIRSSKAYEPLILTTKDPVKLIGSLTQFPAEG